MAILTIGFVLEIGSGALYFTEQKSSVSDLRPLAGTAEKQLNFKPLPNIFKCCLFGLVSISNIDCLSLNECLEPVISLSLVGDSSYALNLTVLEIQTIYLDYLLSTPFSLPIETPIYLAASLVSKESSKGEEVSPSNESYFKLVSEKDKGQEKSSVSDPQAESTSLQYFKEIYEVDKGQPTNNVYLLAKRHVASGAPTDAKVINQCLSKFDLSITQEELDILVSIEKIELQLPLEPHGLVLESIGRDLSLNHKDSENNRFAGVYVFTHKPTGEQYVGSTINLGSRVRTYFQPGVRANESRLIIQSLNNYGVENFTLSIYKIDPKLFKTNFKPLDFSRALEQYYIFTFNSVLNEIKVAGGFSGGPMEENTKLAIGKANSVPIYVYNQDKSILHYSATSTWSFLREVKMAHNTLSTYLANGEALHGRFVFSKELIQGAVISLMDVKELSQILADARALQKIKNLPHPNVSTTLIDNETGKEYLFNSLISASKFTKSFALTNSRYIAQSKLSCMKSGDSFKGWTVRKN
jgi:hypothetical protein